MLRGGLGLLLNGSTGCWCCHSPWQAQSLVQRCSPGNAVHVFMVDAVQGAMQCPDVSRAPSNGCIPPAVPC